MTSLLGRTNLSGRLGSDDSGTPVKDVDEIQPWFNRVNIHEKLVYPELIPQQTRFIRTPLL